MVELQALILDNLVAIAIGVAVAIGALGGFFFGRRRAISVDDDPELLPGPTSSQPQSLMQRLASGLSRSRDALTGRLDGVFSRSSVDEELYEELSDALIMADVGVKAAERILQRLKRDAKELKIKDPEQLRERLKIRLLEILEINSELVEKPADSPLVILVVGVNGGGKTTTIGKLAGHYVQKGYKVLLGAGDTYRAGAIEQLTVWAERAGAEIVAHAEGADPAAVLFDALSAAKARNCDVVICDTAGRLQNRRPLMDQLSKVTRVLKKAIPDAPHEVILVLDSTIGQNALSQAKLFGEAVDLTGLILTKLDGTAKGGVVIAVREETKLPVKFIGVGEQMDDLRPFVAKDFVDALLGP